MPVVVGAGGCDDVGFDVAGIAGDGGRESAGVAVAGGDDLRRHAVALTIEVVMHRVDQAGDGDGVHQAGVVDGDGEGDGAAQFIYARRVGRLVNGNGGRHVGESDRRVVAVADGLPVVVNACRSDNVIFNMAGIAGDVGGEGAGVTAAGRDGLWHVAGSQAVEVAMYRVDKGVDGHAVYGADVVDGDAEGDGAAGFRQADGAGVLDN